MNSLPLLSKVLRALFCNVLSQKKSAGHFFPTIFLSVGTVFACLQRMRRHYYFSKSGQALVETTLVLIVGVFLILTIFTFIEYATQKLATLYAGYYVSRQLMIENKTPPQSNDSFIEAFNRLKSNLLPDIKISLSHAEVKHPVYKVTTEMTPSVFCRHPFSSALKHCKNSESKTASTIDEHRYWSWTPNSHE